MVLAVGDFLCPYSSPLHFYTYDLLHFFVTRVMMFLYHVLRWARPTLDDMIYCFFLLTQDVPGLHFAFSNRAGCPGTVRLAGVPWAYCDGPQLLFMHVLFRLFHLPWLMAFLHFFLGIFACLLSHLSCIRRLLFPDFHSAFGSPFGFLQRLEDGGCSLINVR